eukprot:5311324-Pleurochrysis_carterae.AAC.3
MASRISAVACAVAASTPREARLLVGTDSSRLAALRTSSDRAERPPPGLPTSAPPPLLPLNGAAAAMPAMPSDSSTTAASKGSSTRDAVTGSAARSPAMSDAASCARTRRECNKRTVGRQSASAWE